LYKGRISKTSTIKPPLEEHEAPNRTTIPSLACTQSLLRVLAHRTDGIYEYGTDGTKLSVLGCEYPPKTTCVSRLVADRQTDEETPPRSPPTFLNSILDGLTLSLPIRKEIGCALGILGLERSRLFHYPGCRNNGQYWIAFTLSNPTVHLPIIGILGIMSCSNDELFVLG
jgi:hypothetical protein